MAIDQIAISVRNLAVNVANNVVQWQVNVRIGIFLSETLRIRKFSRDDSILDSRV